MIPKRGFLLQPARAFTAALPDRLRERFGEKAVSMALALAIEAILLLAIFTLGQSMTQKDEPELIVTNIQASNVAEESEQPPEAAEAPTEPEPQLEKPDQVEDTPDTPAPIRPAPAIDAPTIAPRIALRPDPLAGSPRIEAPKADAQPKAKAVIRQESYGPPNVPFPGDSKRVGNAPNGEPMYAAEWYREPYPDELRGYLSTAEGPGYGLIACKTAPDYRVEDCVELGESPPGSNIARAAKAAAWQFLVRPARVGGKPQIGSWVRIQITYALLGS